MLSIDKNSKESEFNVESYAKAIDAKSIDNIKSLLKRNISLIKSNNIDIVYELYENHYLTPERLQFITKYCSKYLKVSSKLKKELISKDETSLLDIIYSSVFIKEFDNKFILWLLSNYKSKKPVSTLEFNQQYEKYRIPVDKFNKEFEKTRNKATKYLFLACEAKNITLVKYFIQHGVNVKNKNDDGETALFCACENGNLTLVRYLIHQGLDINETNHYGETPLFNACKGGHKSIVKYLHEHGADINKECNYFNTPLFCACWNGNEHLIKYLIRNGAEINQENRDGETPLFLACKSGNEAVVKYLVEHGADMHIRNEEGETPLDHACARGHEKIINYLMECEEDTDSEFLITNVLNDDEDADADSDFIITNYLFKGIFSIFIGKVFIN